MNNPRAVVDNYGNQTGTGRQHRFFLVVPTPICVQLWHPSCGQVERKHFCKLLNPEGTKGNRETLQKSISVHPVCVVDLVQDTLVCLVQRFRQFLEGVTQVGGETES